MKNTFSDENVKKSNHAPRRAHDLISGEKPNSFGISFRSAVLASAFALQVTGSQTSIPLRGSIGDESGIL